MWIVGIALVSLIGYSLSDYLQINIHDSSTKIEKSIAVLPFWNESTEEENAYFVNGMMEDVRNNLSKISGLRVTSRISTEKYRNTNLSANEIAQELNVNYILEGSVQRIGKHVKIHAQLIAPKIDDHIWSDTYTRDIIKIFDVQSEIAQIISHELNVAISPDEKNRIETVPTKNFNAYDLYLQGNEYQWKYKKIDTAILFYKKAIALDPKFAQAYLKLGESYHDKTYWSEYFKETFADSLIIYADMA